MGSTLFTKRYHPHEGRNRKCRHRTFATEEEAKQYAERHSIAKYAVQPMAYTKKFKLVVG